MLRFELLIPQLNKTRTTPVETSVNLQIHSRTYTVISAQIIAVTVKKQHCDHGTSARKFIKYKGTFIIIIFLPGLPITAKQCCAMVRQQLIYLGLNLPAA